MEPEKKEVYLVATDLTKVGDYAIDNAAHMARLTDAKLVILHVVNEATKSLLKKKKKQIDFIGSTLNDMCKKVEAQYGVEADFMAPEGSIFTAIAEAAKTIEATYLFMGTHGKKGIQFLLGSFALKVITTSPAPMFVVKKPGEGNKFKSFVYPLDTELGSKQKVRWAIELNRVLGSAFHLMVYFPNDGPIQRKMTGDLKQVTSIMDQHKVPYTVTHHKSIKAYEKAIISLALQKKADAIIMSTDPQKINWNPFGSPEEKLIYNKEAIPVLCINSQGLKLAIGGP